MLVGATNRLDEIDPAVIREGRFDYKVKIYKPDFDARREILEVLLGERPHDASVDTTRFAHDMEGFTAAQIRHVVDEAALAAMESESSISNDHLREAYTRHVTSTRYRGRRLTWDQLILPGEKKKKLQFIEKFIENPGLARSLGIDPPRGVLLFGPPGTGKTTIARVLASETEASFFAVNAGDIFSKWLGDSERNVKELFEKARDSVPALIFIDEIDAAVDSARLAEETEGASGADLKGLCTSAGRNAFLRALGGALGSPR